MTDCIAKRIRFWRLYQTILNEKGNPFKLYPAYETDGSPKHYAGINSFGEDGRKMPVLTVVYLYREKRCRICVYIENDLDTYNQLFAHKDEIEREVGMELVWKNGEKNKNTRWIKREIQFYQNDEAEWREEIEKSLPFVEKFIAAVKPYVYC